MDSHTSQPLTAKRHPELNDRVIFSMAANHIMTLFCSISPEAMKDCYNFIHILTSAGRLAPAISNQHKIFNTTQQQQKQKHGGVLTCSCLIVHLRGDCASTLNSPHILLILEWRVVGLNEQPVHWCSNECTHHRSYQRDHPPRRKIALRTPVKFSMLNGR